MAINSYMQQQFGGYAPQGYGGYPQQQQDFSGFGGFGQQQGGMPAMYGQDSSQNQWQGFNGIPNSSNGINNLPTAEGSSLLASMFGSPVTNAGIDPLLARLPAAASGAYSMLMGAVGGVLPFSAPTAYQVNSLPPLLSGLSIFGIGQYFRDLNSPISPFAQPSQYGYPSYSNALNPQQGGFGNYNSGGNNFFGQGYGQGQRPYI